MSDMVSVPAEKIAALREERGFWKDNDNKRSAKVRKMRAERDALRERIRALAETVKQSEGGGLYVGPDDILALLGGDA